VLVNPGNALSAATTLREVEEAARTIGLQIQVVNATTIGEIDATFASFASARPDALFVAPDNFLNSRRRKLSPWRRSTKFRRLMGAVIMP
jgi:putative ABC transport system substrate-binding protein